MTNNVPGGPSVSFNDNIQSFLTGEELSGTRYWPLHVVWLSEGDSEQNVLKLAAPTESKEIQSRPL